jgi:short-chain fatty acids transporter
MRRYLPDPFVLTILLTVATMLLAIAVQRTAPLDVLDAWGKGFWNLLAFTTQMVVILAMGYVLARAPLVDRALDGIVAAVSTPTGAIAVATITGGVASYLNWGFGLVVGGIVAKKLAIKVRGVHYPLIIASAYSGFTLYGLGLSATIPILISTKGHALEAQMGIVPLSQTIFAPPIIITGLVVLATLPVLNILLMPGSRERTLEIAPSLALGREAAESPLDATRRDTTLASRLNESAFLSATIGLLGLTYIIIYLLRGQGLDINIINFIVLFSGILLLRTPLRYVETLNEGIRMVGGVVLLYPFYAGLMAIMASTGLVDTISHIFVDAASRNTLSTFGILSSYAINFVAPSAGGHWIIQGPFMIEAAKNLGAPLNQVSMAVMLGNAWNDLVQPFWLLPAVALARIELRNIMGYLVVQMLWVGFIYICSLLIWANVA